MLARCSLPNLATKKRQSKKEKGKPEKETQTQEGTQNVTYFFSESGCHEMSLETTFSLGRIQYSPFSTRIQSHLKLRTPRSKKAAHFLPEGNNWESKWFNQHQGLFLCLISQVGKTPFKIPSCLCLSQSQDCSIKSPVQWFLHSIMVPAVLALLPQSCWRTIPAWRWWSLLHHPIPERNPWPNCLEILLKGPRTENEIGNNALQREKLDFLLFLHQPQTDWTGMILHSWKNVPVTLLAKRFFPDAKRPSPKHMDPCQGETCAFVAHGCYLEREPLFCFSCVWSKSDSLDAYVCG